MGTSFELGLSDLPFAPNDDDDDLGFPPGLLTLPRTGSV